MMKEYQIREVNGHYEIYEDSKFYCSSDTYKEAAHELEGVANYEQLEEAVCPVTIVIKEND